MIISTTWQKWAKPGSAKEKPKRQLRHVYEPAKRPILMDRATLTALRKGWAVLRPSSTSISAIRGCTSTNGSRDWMKSLLKTRKSEFATKFRPRNLACSPVSEPSSAIATSQASRITPESFSASLPRSLTAGRARSSRSLSSRRLRVVENEKHCSTLMLRLISNLLYATLSALSGPMLGSKWADQAPWLMITSTTQTRRLLSGKQSSSFAKTTKRELRSATRFRLRSLG